MSYKVLIVEDERIVAFNLQMRLTKLGYIVTGVAVSAAQALGEIELCAPHIVLMDIHIEGDLDGIDTAALISEKFRIPVIYLTAYSEEKTLLRARATKPHGYLLKPFSERELHATILMAIERHDLELSLSENEQRLRLAMDAANMGDWELTHLKNGTQLFYAGRADINFGHTERTFTGAREQFLRLVHNDDQASFNVSIDRSIADNSALDVEFRSFISPQNSHWLRLQGKVLEDDHHAVTRVIGVIQNIDERKQAELRLQQAATVFDSTQDGILILDVRGLVVACNKAFTAISGYESAEVLNRPPYFLQHNTLETGKEVEFQHVFAGGGQWRGEIRARHKDGTQLPTLATIVSVANTKNNLSHYVLVITDLTAIRGAERKLLYLAHHDPLTSLPNRLLTTERLHQALLRGKRNSERVAVLFIDLDHFKWINDSLGHGIGDLLLQSTALRMKVCLRNSDTIGRLGGDEFLIVLDPADEPNDVALVARKLIKAIGRPIQIESHLVDVSCSIGISLFPEDGANVEDLIRGADTAMYAAKECGRNGYEFYAPRMKEKAQRYLALNHDLHRGFKAGELRLFYQPQFSLRTGAIVGVEALVRWQHPQRGLLGANEIIPLAEDCGMIVDIGNWVLHEAGNQLQRWQSDEIPAVRIAINVSALQMHKRDFANDVCEVLSAASISAQFLEIEITESTLQQEENCISTLEKLRGLGIQISIDDFGTGYSCLSSLKILPIHKVKIDRAFVQDMPHSKNDVAIAEAVIAMAHKLQMSVIAEGVENAEQEKMLRECDCDEVQGFLYARPMPAEHITQLLRNFRPGMLVSA